MGVKNFLSKMFDGFVSTTQVIMPITLQMLGLDSKKKNPYEGDAIISSYQGENWVYACVREISDNIASLPIVVKEKETKKTVTDSKIAELLSKPNSLSTKTDLLNYILSYLELRGECFIIKNVTKRRSSLPKSLMIKDPIRFDYELTSDRTQIKRWIYKYIDENGKTVEIDLSPDEVIFFRYFNPFHDIRGMSPLEAARLSVLEAYHARQYNIKFFQNDAAVSGVLQTDGTIPENAYNRLRQELKEKYEGSENAGKMLILEGGLEYKQVSLSQKDMQYLETRKMTREEICSVFRVPPPVVGIFEYASYANSEQAYISFWTKTLLPKIQFLQDVFNTFLFDVYEPNYYMEFDLSGIPVLQSLLSKKMDIAVKMFSIGYPLEVIDDKLHINFLRDYDGEINPEPENGVPTNVNIQNSFKSMTKSVKDYSYVVLDDYINSISHACNDLIDFYHKEYKSKIEEIKAKNKSTLYFSDFEIEDNVYKGKWKNIFNLLFDNVIDYAEKTLNEEVGLEKYLHYDIIKYYKDLRMGYIDKSFDRLIKELHFAILEDITNEKSILEIDKTITHIFAKFRNHIPTVARTETMFIFNAIRYEMMKENGIEEYTWKVRDKKSCRDTHAHLHNNTIKMGEVFSNNMRFPLDSDDAKEVINCRCVIVPEIKN